MSENQDILVDHLFRHQYGKMVSILTRAFGLDYLEVIEDAVQDTFIKALQSWKHQKPDNPEAWLMTAARNRLIDIFRKIKADTAREVKLSGPSSIAIREIFLDSEIEDSQLRMIYTACHPMLKSEEQIAFALKTISGFSEKEIAAALLQKPETIKKRLQRARKRIKDSHLKFEVPQGHDLVERQSRVFQTIYLIFNEGFHSNSKDQLVRKEICMEAIRLGHTLLHAQPNVEKSGFALMALMCFHSARLESKLDDKGMLISLRKQDRSLWDKKLIMLGNMHMTKAVETEMLTSYHYEAAIAAEHLKAEKFEDTDWERIEMWYDRLYAIAPSPFVLLNKAIAVLQLGDLEKCKELLDSIDQKSLTQREYLYHCTLAEFYEENADTKSALRAYKVALELVQNEREREYLLSKVAGLTG